VLQRLKFDVKKIQNKSFQVNHNQGVAARRKHAEDEAPDAGESSAAASPPRRAGDQVQQAMLDTARVATAVGESR